MALLAKKGSSSSSSEGEEGDRTALIVGSAAPKAYRGRWWIALTYSVMACVQGAQWTIPGSIQPTMMVLYGLDGNTIQLLLNYGPIGWFVTCFFFSWHMDRHGCRFSVLAAIWLVFLSNLLRVFARDASTLSVALIHISFLLNAFAGPVAMAACSKLSEDWFLVSERTTATAVMAEANNCAGVLMWLLVPTLVQDQTMADCQALNYALLGISGTNVVMAHAYFPSHPPTPPSASAEAQKRAESGFTPGALWRSMVLLTRHRSFMVIMVAYSCICGMANALSSLLVNILSNIGYSQTQTGWVGFASSCIGLAMGLLLARYTDKKRNQRKALIVSLVLSGITWGLFAVIAQGLLPGSFTNGAGGFLFVGICFTACNAFFDAAIPLFFELSVEVTYPIPEATVIMYLTSGMNLATAGILAVPMDSLGTGWMPWGMTVATFLFTALIAVFFARESPRYEYDQKHVLLGGGEEDEDGDPEEGGRDTRNVRVKGPGGEVSVVTVTRTVSGALFPWDASRVAAAAARGSDTREVEVAGPGGAVFTITVARTASGALFPWDASRVAAVAARGGYEAVNS
jgi:MFS family permease